MVKRKPVISICPVTAVLGYQAWLLEEDKEPQLLQESRPHSGAVVDLRKEMAAKANEMGAILRDPFCRSLCGGFYERYMLKNEVWAAAWPHGSDGLLCLMCVEKQLDRPLTITDFSLAPINDHIFFGFNLGLKHR